MARHSRPARRLARRRYLRRRWHRAGPVCCSASSRSARCSSPDRAGSLPGVGGPEEIVIGPAELAAARAEGLSLARAPAGGRRARRAGRGARPRRDPLPRGARAGPRPRGRRRAPPAGAEPRVPARRRRSARRRGARGRRGGALPRGARPRHGPIRHRRASAPRAAREARDRGAGAGGGADGGGAARLAGRAPGAAAAARGASPSATCSSTRRGAAARREAEARAAAAALAAGGPVAGGDPCLAAPEQPLQSEALVARLLGPGFAAALFEAPQGAWSGPLRSSLGWHAVRVEANARRARRSPSRRCAAPRATRSSPSAAPRRWSASSPSGAGATGSAPRRPPPLLLERGYTARPPRGEQACRPTCWSSAMAPSSSPP